MGEAETRGRAKKGERRHLHQKPGLEKGKKVCRCSWKEDIPPGETKAGARVVEWEAALECSRVGEGRHGLWQSP